MKLLNCNRCGVRGRDLKIVYLFWTLLLSEKFLFSAGFFFPFFGNFFNRFRNNNQFGGVNGGVTLFSGGNGNATSIRVPMLQSVPERRIDVLTTVVSNSVDDPQVRVQNNVTTAAATDALLNSKLVVPTSTSVTTSVSSSQQRLGTALQPNTLTLPFTPNLFGMMSFMHALKDIKRNYKDQEKERKLELFNKSNGDLMSRVMKTLIQKVVNKHQKHTEILKLKILKRQEKLQNFLQLPMVSQVVASDPALQPAALRRNGLSRPAGTAQAGRRFPSIFNAFLI